MLMNLDEDGEAIEQERGCLEEWLFGRPPNAHEALFWAGHKGPEMIHSFIRFSMIMLAMYLPAQVSKPSSNPSSPLPHASTPRPKIFLLTDHGQRDAFGGLLDKWWLFVLHKIFIFLPILIAFRYLVSSLQSQVEVTADAIPEAPCLVSPPYKGSACVLCSLF